MIPRVIGMSLFGATRWCFFGEVQIMVHLAVTTASLLERNSIPNLQLLIRQVPKCMMGLDLFASFCCGNWKASSNYSYYWCNWILRFQNIGSLKYCCYFCVIIDNIGLNLNLEAHVFVILVFAASRIRQQCKGDLTLRLHFIRSTILTLKDSTGCPAKFISQPREQAQLFGEFPYS